MRRFKTLLALCFVILLVCSVASAQRRRAGQVSFGMEESIERPVRVPQYVIREIIRSEEHIAFMDRFEGTLVNLNNDGRPDLLVQGDPGANITGFWVFRNTGRKWQLVLYTRALSLNLERTYRNGFRDVSVVAASAVMSFGADYRFNSRRYVPRRCGEQRIEEGARRRYISCSGDPAKPYR